MKRRIIAVGAAIFFMLPLRLQSDTQEPATAQQSQKAIVTLTVDYGDGAQKRFPEIPWMKAMTVHDALLWADKHPRGIDFESRGTGKTTLVTKIDDLRNGDSSGNNWVYRVNDKLGDKSCAVFPINAGDCVLWRFERYQ